MNATDSRHGTYAGYQAHVNAGQSPVTCEPCKAARRRRDKADRLRVARGIPAMVEAPTVLETMSGWLHMGVAATALDRRLGHRGGGVLARIVSGEITAVRLATFMQLRAITEADLPDSARVYAGLTRYRVFSLMAAGHRLLDLDILPTGRWRTAEHTTIGQARTVRTTYGRLEQAPGGDRGTASRARNRGVLPPAGWDDPGTLAWPRGWPLPGEAGEDPAPLDEVAIWRRTHGDRSVPLTVDEQDQLVARCRDAGWEWGRIERTTGVNVRRAVRRLQEVA